MLIITDLSTLVAAIDSRVAGAPGRLVAIEGHSQSGKTTLAKSLATFTGWPAISTDDFVTPDDSAESYLALVDIPRLRSAIIAAHAESACVLLEGICLRETLDALSLTPSAYVYVRRITPVGLWADDPGNDSEDGDNTAGQDKPGWVDRQSRLYHCHADPLSKATFVFDRVEE